MAVAALVCTILLTILVLLSGLVVVRGAGCMALGTTVSDISLWWLYRGGGAGDEQVGSGLVIPW